MKTLLKTVLWLQIIAVVINFIAILEISAFHAVIAAAITALSVVPTVAIMLNQKDLDELHDEVNSLRYKIRKLDDDIEAIAPESERTARPFEPSLGTWTCVKCGAVNKARTTHCENCGAKYSYAQNPTSDESEKKQVSRWVK